MEDIVDGWVRQYVRLKDDYGPFKKGDVTFCTADLPEGTGHDVFCVLGHEGQMVTFQPHEGAKKHFELWESDDG